MTQEHDTDGLNSNASESSSDRHRLGQPQKAKTRWWLVLVLVLTLIPAGALLWECTRPFFGRRREQPAGRPGEVSGDRETTGGLFTGGSGYGREKEKIRALYRDKQILIERTEELAEKLATSMEKQAELEEKQDELLALLDSKDAQLVAAQTKIMALEDRGTKTEGVAETVKRLILVTERVTRLEEANRMLLEELAKALEEQGKHAQARKLREKLAEMRQRSSKTQPTTAPTTRKDAPVGRNTPNHATLPETRMTNVQGPWCGTSQLMAVERLKAETDVLLLQVELALYASELLLAPDSPDAAREDATTILKNVMKDLRKLEASFDPKTGGAAVSPNNTK